MLATMSSRQFAEWLAYNAAEPFGEERADLRNAVLCCLVANALRGTGRKASVEDFMPKFESKKAQTPEEMLAAAMAFAGVAPG